MDDREVSQSVTRYFKPRESTGPNVVPMPRVEEDARGRQQRTYR